MVLLEQAHHIISEVRHVFANQEADVSTNNLLVMNDLVTDCVLHPLSVRYVSQLV